MLLVGTRNVGTQTVLTDGIINVGTVYRRYCKPTCNGLPTFVNNGNSLTLNGQGIYHVTAKFVGAGTETGALTVQAVENGAEILGEFASEAITVADTQLRSVYLDFYVLVDKTCVLNNRTTLAKTISFSNAGVGATFTSVTVNVDKVV